METAKLKKFAQYARRSLLEQVSAKLKLVLAENSAARRERAEAVKKLEETIKEHSKGQVIERVSYIWFNRFCALRFMDMNRYNRVNVVSPADPGQFQPEILAEAKMGHIDEEMVHDKVRQQIFALLDGKAPSRDPQGEAYRLLVVAACNFWNKAMPFLFQRIDDYTELLMPDDLLSGNSILAYTREAMTPDVCEDVEVIGWLYQFYISEKKDEVFDGLKKNKKIMPENIPAATQLFTPHWIVRYLVENSLGRLWLLNRPGSKLVEQMDYYIKPPENENGAETDFLKISKPEEIKICDPACGSGHMLTYAFDLLYAIYEEEGVDPAEIPEKILTHNLYGIEIDERAGELAAFALTMKARAKQRRFFNKGIKPNICVLENVHFDEAELNEYMDFVGRDLFNAPLQITLRQFEEADNFGSLICPEVTDVEDILCIVKSKDVSGQLFLNETHTKALQALRQADYLSPKYHVVIANPPYMGGKGMNGRLASWSKDNFPDSKSDLFAMFIERGLDLVPIYGFSAMVTMQSWMFLSSYESLRLKLLKQTAIESLAHMANMVMGIAFGTSATVWQKGGKPQSKGAYCFVDHNDIGRDNKPTIFPPHNKRNKSASEIGWIFRVADQIFSKIPGTPIAYWVSDQELKAYSSGEFLGSIGYPRKGLDTGENDRFLRLWQEVCLEKSCLDNSNNSRKWFPYNKGGDFRRWYGNREYLINWQSNGDEIKRRLNWASKKPTIRNADYYFREGFTWTTVSSGGFSARYCPPGALFDNGGCTVFSDAALFSIGGFINTKVLTRQLEFLSPTLNYQPGDIARAAFPKEVLHTKTPTKVCVNIAKQDWDSFETSWDFTGLPLLNPGYRQPTLKATYQKLRTHWREMTLEMQRLEEENNRIFIEAYGLQDELTPEVPLNEITLTCNPHYRYGNDKSEDELEALLLADTMCELVSYAVGCMFGRYALDKPGLILANQGETIEDYLKRFPEPCFPADEDNVIPMLDGDWFMDDIAERFRAFLKVAFGADQYEENLTFVEEGLGKDIRKYFLKDFYSDHLRRYKKRPIYWLFTSPKGSFNALIYMHRYRPDTVSVVLNDYLREFRTKLTAHKNHLEAVSISASASQGEKTKALKEIEKITKMIAEMEEYEREVLYPLATEQVEIDLDDGVKVNYPKFGAALKKIVGLDAAED